MSAPSRSWYVVTWRDHRDGSVQTLRARTVEDSSLGLSFVAIRDFLFESGPIVNPAEEALRGRLEKVRTLHLSLYAILSVEEVGEDPPALVFTNDKAALQLVRPSEPSKD
ncbi:MAG: DUF1820 family protein [Alphaproteobacteria bacterium]|nr:DUF1820 family protein [Alphaproteobacteria bacterium]MCB9696346.1 DUF1820 family protein [Alphaproteobacteria bacterium]